MVKNRIKAAWSRQQPALNGWLSIPNGFSAEIMAAQAFDSVTVDAQHGVVGYTDAVRMFQAMRASNVTPVARVPWLEPGIIMKMLDAGAYGIICPMVNNRKQAQEFVSYVRYPPDGIRSFGPTRAIFAGGPNYFAEANENVVCLAMVETAEAYANLTEIAATPGLDGIYIGPADLTLGLTDGRLAPGLDREEQEIVDALHRIRKVCHDAGIKAGIHTVSTEYAVKAIEWGFDLVTLISDVRLLAAAASAHVDEVRRRIGIEQQSENAKTTSY
ncbi:MAG: aldolase/citrate lyase family protein [Rhodobacteraceae bacterium]|nr:aldolase/citrate lyase family protein [Paracoccaceae bacterium]